MIYNDMVCEGCRYDDSTQIHELEGLKLRHCASCRLTSVVDPVTTVSYDAAYVAERYDRYPTTQQMSGLRLAYVETVLRLNDALPMGHTNVYHGNREIVDIGYGNGSYIRWATQNGWETYGHDVNPTDYPGVRKLGALPDPLTDSRRYRAITFFDTLEHFEHLNHVRWVSACTDWIFVTAPLPPLRFPGEYARSWWENQEKLPWKHWRPGEHHHYMHPETLEELFTWDDEIAGIRAVANLTHVSHFEDSIRGVGQNGRPNTFTAALRCTTFQDGDG